ncbi:phage tail assembly protein [Anaerobacillus sp. HL2]|nr:phage tail assembly protein [Anaerobacillus sp. HL2]
MAEKAIFDKPITFEDKEYTEFVLDFDGLSGKDMIAAEKETRLRGDNPPVLELNKTFQAIVAAKAAKVPTDMVLLLPAKEFTKVTLLAQSFLLN